MKVKVSDYIADFLVKKGVEEWHAHYGQSKSESDCEEDERGSHLAHIACARCADHFPQGDCGADERVDPQEQEAWTPHHVYAVNSCLGAFTFEFPEEDCGSAGQRREGKYERARYGKGPAQPRRP